MNLAEKAFHNLFPEKINKRVLELKYSAKFSSYNANVKYTPERMTFSLSKEWIGVSEEIVLGLLEHLLCKVYKKDIKTSNQDMYASFMKHLTKVARIEEKDPYLLFRFQVINDQYFHGMMSEPNLKWGQSAYRKLGHYEYASDTIVISSIFVAASENAKVEALLDFVLYHEMLHKKHQYNPKAKRAQHHTKAFRDDEKLWLDKDVEKKLSLFLAKKRIGKALRLR